MAHIGIIGGGNVGANTAFFLAERDVADVVLFDIKEGLSKGKALDMMEAAPVRGYQVKLSGTDLLDDVLSADLLIIAAGAGVKADTTAESLFTENRGIIEDLASSLRGYSGVVLIVTEPVDLLTTLFVRSSGLDATKVLGLGGFLDETRLRYLIAEHLSIAPEGVDATVIGYHSDAMIPLSSYCRVSGIPVADIIDEKTLEGIFDKAKQAGESAPGAFYGPAAAASDLAEMVLRNTRRIASVSQMLDGQCGISGVALSLPAVIGKNGIEKVLEPKLTDEQRKALEASAADVAKALGSGD